MHVVLVLLVGPAAADGVVCFMWCVADLLSLPFALVSLGWLMVPSVAIVTCVLLPPVVVVLHGRRSDRCGCV